MQVNGGPRRPRRAHERAGQTGLIDGFTATIDMQNFTCIIKNGLPHANQVSASCFASFDNERDTHPTLVAVNIPRVCGDGKMDLAVLLGGRGADAVCWSVAFRCPYTVPSAGLTTVDPCSDLRDKAAVFKLDVDASTNWLDQYGFGPDAKQAIETAVLQQKPLDLQVVLWPLVPMLSVTDSWTVSFGVHFAKQQGPVESLEVRNVTLPFLYDLARLLDAILTAVHSHAVHFKGSQDDRLPDHLKLNPGATPGKKVLQRAREIVEVVGSTSGKWAVFADKSAARAFSSIIGGAKLAAMPVPYTCPEPVSSSSGTKKAQKAPILVLSNNKQARVVPLSQNLDRQAAAALRQVEATAAAAAGPDRYALFPGATAPAAGSLYAAMPPGMLQPAVYGQQMQTLPSGNSNKAPFNAAAPTQGQASAALDSLLPAVLPFEIVDTPLGTAFGDFLGAYINRSKSRERTSRHSSSNSRAMHPDEALIAEQQAAAPGIDRHARGMSTGSHDRLDTDPHPLPPPPAAAAAPPAGFRSQPGVQAPGSAAWKRKQQELSQDFSLGHETGVPTVQDMPDCSHARRSSSASCMSKCAEHSGFQQQHSVQDIHESSEDDADLRQLLADATDGVESPEQ